MNEKAINQVISEYAIENANLRMTLAVLQQENAELKEDKKEEVE